ncbi:pyridoxal-phosphate dependent enzyme [Halococcus dombrowskii]|uniref:Pyridoxal-phosphate dependent enzyme n=1 Tax=Halococcus dombrowskii TaxID=179637 RepID=A0AAV3SDD2_HALDO|nr:pyridoxal-phosphate dependent enzyme [Halococcus dombrowskii]UOO96063.1 pyridoxal-phosphate dependent enzyme [Halococcus dombrowskii]
MPPDLQCAACGTRYADRWRCACGHPLDFVDRPLPEGSPPTPTSLDTREGLWTFDKFLPVERRVTLGAGWTPLVDAPNWNCAFKFESVSPTGSFKDRGAALTVSRALACGAERLVEDSSGNAGTAIATYAARAGLESEIYVPADATAAKLRAIEHTGADVVRVDGSRGDVTEAAIDAVETGAGWYASHAWRPSFDAGTSTIAFEIAAQRDWHAPEAVVCPLGHGTLFLGLSRGFRALADVGWIDDPPRLLAAQAAGYAPFVGDSDSENDRADGIHIREPVRADEIEAAIAETGGDVIAIDAAATDREHERLHEAGFPVEPTSAVAPAALREYRERRVLADDADVVVPLTGRAKN